MPVRAVNICEKSNIAEPPNVITLAAKTATKVLYDLRDPNVKLPNNLSDFGTEVAARYIQNNTGAKLYVTYGFDSPDNNTNWHLILADQQQADFSNYGGPVYAYSVAGGQVGTLIIHRQDLFQHGNQAGLKAPTF